jgi:microcystin-dependent protein
MSSYPFEWLTDTSGNRTKQTSMIDFLDLSGNLIVRNGNLYLAPNSNIYTENNQIQFNEEFQFTDFTNNVNVLGQLKNTYNSVEYDVGLQCEKTDQLVDDVETLSPIVSDTAFKCTNFYYDQASNSTVWSGLLTCPISSIASTAIANTTRFIEGTGNQNVGGIKRFTSNIRIDAGMVLNNNTLTLTNANLQKIAFISTASSDLQTQISTINTNLSGYASLSADNIFTGTTNQFSNTLRLDGSLNLNANALVIPNSTLQKIQYLSTLSSDVQTQINTLTTNLSGYASLSADNTFLSPINTFNNTLNLNGSLKINNTLTIPQSTLFKLEFLQNVTSDIQNQINNINGVSLSASNVFTALNRFSNNIRLDGSLIVNNNGTTLTNDNLNRIQWLSGVSSSVSTSLTNLNTSVSTLNTKTTKMSYMSVGGINTTTILDGLISQTFSFTGTINNISTTTFGYISGLTSSAQSQLNNLASKLTDITYTAGTTTTTIANNIIFTGSINNIIPAVFSYLSNLSGNIQDQFNALAGRITAISYTAGTTTTTIANNLVFSGTLNTISTTTFGYLSGLSGAIQTQLNSLSTRIATFEIVGTIIMSPLLDLQTTTSNKYLMCNGQAVSRTTYSALFDKFGELFGAGNGSTTFNLPNYNGMFLRGMGNQIINGVNYGNYNSTYAPDQDSIQNHTHSGQSGSFLGTVNIQVSPSYRTGTGDSPNAYTFSNTGQMATGRINDFETKPVSIGIYYYVKT